MSALTICIRQIKSFSTCSRLNLDSIKIVEDEPEVLDQVAKDLRRRGRYNIDLDTALDTALKSINNKTKKSYLN